MKLWIALVVVFSFFSRQIEGCQTQAYDVNQNDRDIDWVATGCSITGCEMKTTSEPKTTENYRTSDILESESIETVEVPIQQIT
jgi:hypothetical protein